MEPIRIVLANHHPIIRSNLRLLLEREPAFRVIGEAADGREAVALAEYRRPDVVLLDVQLPPVNGISIAREMTSKKHGFGIIFISVLTDQEYISEALRAGARGYVLEDAAATDLFRAVRAVAGGGSFLSPAIGHKLVEEHLAKRPGGALISEYERQHEVAEMLQRIGAPAEILDSIRDDLSPLR